MVYFPEMFDIKISKTSDHASKVQFPPTTEQKKYVYIWT